jgi:endonuclease/exonuclease/phosphatase family metal-dependent hydrolase
VEENQGAGSIQAGTEAGSAASVSPGVQTGLGAPAGPRARRPVPRFGPSVLLPALTLMFGMQVLRTLLPLLVYVLRDRFGLLAPHLGLIALVLFAGSFLVSPCLRALGPRRLALYSAVGVGVCRLLIQLWAWDPVVDLVLAFVGTLLFLFYLPAALVLAGWRTAGGGIGSGATSVYALGILTGLALDTVLNGLLQTYDLAWRSGIGALVPVVALVALQTYLALGDRLARGAGSEEASSRGPLVVGPWIAFGSMLALEMLLFQNVARLATLAGLSLPASAALTGAAHAAGLAIAGWLYVVQGAPRASEGDRGSAASALLSAIVRALAVTAGVILVLSVIPASAEGFYAGLLFVTGQVALSYLLMVIVGSVGPGRIAAAIPEGGRGGYGRLSAVHGTGMLLMVIMLFLYYSGYDLRLPFSADIVPPIAALVVGACALWAVIARARADASVGEGSVRVRRPALEWRLFPALLVVATLLVPVVQWGMLEEPSTEAGNGYPVRVMTFNLHNGFGTDGDLDLEALARVIEAEAPDIVALQEVSRGWVVNGTVDALSWLEQRLGMRALWGPTSGSLWGNAVLTRLAVVQWATEPLPTPELLLKRGYIEATVDVGGGETLEVFATHYHHTEDGGPERVLESEALLEAWGKLPRTVLMGDLNAVTGDTEIEMLRKSGLVEILDVAGIVPGYTYSSDDPYERIDYILASEDLAGSGGPAPSDVHITEGTASDHLGIAATLSR